MAEKKIDIVVLKQFRDKFDHETMYKPGQELSFPAKRANDVISRGLAKALDAEAKAKAAEEAEKAAKAEADKKAAEEAAKAEADKKASEKATN